MAADNYPACVAFVRKQEGGNTDLVGDRGGRTGRGGVTHVVYDEYRRSRGLPKQDVFKISDIEIANIYEDKYWTPVHGNSLPEGLDLCAFDYSINSGPARAKKELQHVSHLPVAEAIQELCSRRLSFMRSLHSWSRFGKGWGRRVAQCEALALQMAKADLKKVSKKISDKRDEHVKTAHNATGGAVIIGSTGHYLQYGWGVLLIVAAVVFAGAVVSMIIVKRQKCRLDALREEIMKSTPAEKKS